MCCTKVFSPCRILLLTAKVPTKIDCHFHYLEIQALESKRGNQFSLTINDRNYSFLTGDDSTCSAVSDSMISALNNAIRNIFPTVPLQHIIKKIDVIPIGRLQQIRDLEAVASSRREIGPCGGFSAQYACMCDFHGITYREEVAWDIDNIYIALNTRELCLKDFDYLDQKDLLPVISALEYNTWFTKLRANQLKLSHDNLERILYVLKRSLNLEEIFFDNLGLKADFVNKLNTVLKNTHTTTAPLHTIDLSFNTIEDKGGAYLAGCVTRLTKGVRHLNLSHCGLNAKGVQHLANALSSNTNALTTLTYLNLSGNNLKDDINNLCGFLSQSNALQHIDVSGTDLILENVFGALSRGCTTHLVHLNVSRNPFSTKKQKEAPLSFKQFCSASLNLKYLNMAHCKLPQEALKNLLLGLACNEYTKEVTVDISNNNLGAQGAHVLESCIHGVRSISSLDISENSMDSDLGTVIQAISRNKSLKHLYCNRCMKKHMPVIVDALVQLVQDDECVLQTLNLSDCRLRTDLYNLFNALGDNKSLTHLDISGNQIGDCGARLLAKALQINRTLKTLMYDRNNVTLQGYNDIVYALETNTTLQYIPYPIHDVLPHMKNTNYAQAIDIVTRRVQELLNRNVTSLVQHHRIDDVTLTQLLQPGFLLTSKQQALDRLIAQAQDAIKRDDVNQDDVTHVQMVLADADNTKQLLVRLQELAQQSKGRDGKNPIEVQLQQSICDIHNSICDYLHTTTEKMLKYCREQCPYVLHDDEIVQEIKKNCRNKKQIPVEQIGTAIRQYSSVEIMNRVREMNLGLASELFESIIDEVYESLMRTYKVLVGDSSAIRIDSPVRRSRLSSSDSSRHRTSDVSITDTVSHQSDHSPMATPHLSIKRRSMHGCKLRPKSVVDSVEGLSSADDVSTVGRQNASTMPTTTNDEEEDSVSELPSSSSQQLQHLVKGRPRRTKTRAPTRPLVRAPAPSSGGGGQDACNTDDVDDTSEGLESFFRPGSVTPTSSTNHYVVTDDDVNHDRIVNGTKTSRSRSIDNLNGDDQNSTDDVSKQSKLQKTLVSLLGTTNNSNNVNNSKQRPRSMVNSSDTSVKSDLALFSNSTSPNNSTSNTPDSLGSSNGSSLDRKVTRDVSKLKRNGDATV